jgi:hypothetical protein
MIRHQADFFFAYNFFVIPRSAFQRDVRDPFQNVLFPDSGLRIPGLL